MSDDRAGVVLVGLPGSGKSTVGRLVAQRLGRPFVDTDELVARRTGRTPAELIADVGEPAFRDAETLAVDEALATTGSVIATGGGAVLDPLSRWALWSHGVSIWLDAPASLLAERLRGDATSRPLLPSLDAAHLAAVGAAR